MSNGPSIVLGIASPGPGIINNRDNVVDVWATGSHLQVAVNGHALIDSVDAQPILSGGVGLGAIWESNVRYDYALVSSMPAVPEPDEWATLLAGGLLVGRHVRRKRRFLFRRGETLAP